MSAAVAIEDRRDELFRCPHVERDLARKHCLRRQGEKRRAGEEWLPVHQACVGCPVGATNRALLAGVAVTSCSACGAALVGGEECVTCREKRELHVVKPRGPDRPPPQARIWTPEVPDVPLGAPPRSPSSGPDDSYGSGSTPWDEDNALLNEPPTPRASANQKPPAIAPAERSSMKGKRSKPCPGCGTLGTRCKKICPTKGQPREVEATAKPPEVSPKAPVPTAPVLIAGDKIELRLASDDEVLALVAAVRNELALREHAAALRLATLQRARAAA